MVELAWRRSFAASVSNPVVNSFLGFVRGIGRDLDLPEAAPSRAHERAIKKYGKRERCRVALSRAG
jgi:hypothetical protein